MKKINIGIVDDNKDFCEVVSEYLSARKTWKYFLQQTTEWRPWSR